MKARSLIRPTIFLPAQGACQDGWRQRGPVEQYVGREQVGLLHE
jgi:hypothetical protein